MIEIQTPSISAALGHNGNNFVLFTTQNYRNVTIYKFNSKYRLEEIYARSFTENLDLDNLSVYIVKTNESGQLFRSFNRNFIIDKNNKCNVDQNGLLEATPAFHYSIAPPSLVHKSNKYIVFTSFSMFCKNVINFFDVIFNVKINNLDNNDIVVFELETKKLQIFTLPEFVKNPIINPEENVLGILGNNKVYFIDLE